MLTNKKINDGKIIAIVGAPRSGKSFLAGLLAKHYNSKVFLEGEENDFPDRIKEDIEKNTRPLERILWFRNKLVEKYLLAITAKKNGQIVILDTFWISYQLYIDALTNGFENDIMNEVANIDFKTLSWPDVTIFLSVNENSMRKFIEIGGRKFDKSEEFIINQALPVNQLHQKFFSTNNFPSKILTIERDELDFSNPKDFNKLIQDIESMW